jgi:hypothetical protein
MRLICNSKQHAGRSQAGDYHLFHRASCVEELLLWKRSENVFYLSVALAILF